MIKVIRSACAGLLFASAISATPVFAATVDVTAQHSSVFGDTSGSDKWFVGVSYTNGTETRSNVGAGVFRLQAALAKDETTRFLAFCLSPFEWLRLPLQYTVGTDLNDTTIGRLASLVNLAWGKIADSDTAAAFQLAIWEIVSERPDNKLNITEGLFHVTGIASGSAGKYAQNWLDDVQSGNFKADLANITIFSADNTQDLLTGDLPPAPVPLPGAAGLLLLALFALGGAAKARRIA